MVTLPRKPPSPAWLSLFRAGEHASGQWPGTMYHCQWAAPRRAHCTTRGLCTAAPGNYCLTRLTSSCNDASYVYTCPLRSGKVLKANRSTLKTSPESLYPFRLMPRTRTYHGGCIQSTENQNCRCILPLAFRGRLPKIRV